MSSKELQDIRIALERVTQQQEDYRQLFDAKTASLADAGLGSATTSNPHNLGPQKRYLDDISTEISKIKIQVLKVAEQA